MRVLWDVDGWVGEYDLIISTMLLNSPSKQPTSLLYHTANNITVIK